MEGHESLISFLGWFALTYYWFYVNLTFAGTIQQAIVNHNDAIRQEALQKHEDEDEDEDKDEDEDEDEDEGKV